jgi:hypothetical protein
LPQDTAKNVIDCVLIFRKEQKKWCCFWQGSGKVTKPPQLLISAFFARAGTLLNFDPSALPRVSVALR